MKRSIELDFTIRVARCAGQRLMKHFKTDPELARMRGSVKSVVTAYDKEVDDLIVNEIERAYPGHSLLTEERGKVDKGSDYLWIVDSLDGTANFAAGNPMFSVCIAMARKGQLEVGVVYVPAMDELFYAQRGEGTFLNNGSRARSDDRRLEVSGVSVLRDAYTYVCEGGEKNRRRTLRLIDAVYPRVKDARKLGSAGIEAAWIAAGRADAYVTTAIEPWDVAPAVLLVQEAGGKVTDFHSTPWKARRSNLVFSNGTSLHNRILDAVKHYRH